MRRNRATLGWRRKLPNAVVLLVTLGIFTTILARNFWSLQHTGQKLQPAAENYGASHLRGGQGENKNLVWVHTNSQPFVSLLIDQQIIFANLTILLKMWS